MNAIKKLVSLCVAITFAIALVGTVIGLPVKIAMNYEVTTVGHIVITYVIISLIYIIWNWNVNYWFHENVKVELWQTILITVLLIMLIFNFLTE